MTPYRDYERNCNCDGEGCNLSCTRMFTTKQRVVLTIAFLVNAALLIGIGYCMGSALLAASTGAGG